MIHIAYATKNGSTQEVADAIAETLRGHGLEVEARPAAAVEELDRYDGVVLGGAIYFGRLHPDARRFLKRFRVELTTVPLAVFAMGPKTTEENDVQDSRRQLDAALADVPELEPVSVAIFGGVVDPRKLHFPLNHMAASDARDWNAIREWAEEVEHAVGAGVPAA
jgi:menaquinone-dependent protoporphyrinogen oxidase